MNRTSFSILIATVLAAGLTQADPAWRTFLSPENDKEVGARITGQPYSPPVPEEEGEGGGGIQALAAAVPDCEVDNPNLPEIKELARGLEYDPWRVYEYCHNRVRFDPYWGSKKGSILTLLEESGNSFDTAALMVALLRASGCPDVEYRYGVRLFFETEVDDWFGLLKTASNDGIPFPDLSDTAFRSRFKIPSGTPITTRLRHRALRTSLLANQGFPRVEYVDLGNGSDAYLIPHVWVKFTDLTGVTREVDPSFKPRARRLESYLRPGLNSFAYSDRVSYLNGTIGPASPGPSSVSGINNGQIESTLSQYSTNLLNWFGSQHPGASTSDFIDEGWPAPVQDTWEANELSEGVHYMDVPWLSVTSWATIPDTWKTKITFAFGDGTFNEFSGVFQNSYWNRILNTSCLQGKKLSIFMLGTTGNQLYFRLDEATLFGANPYLTLPVNTFGVAVSVTHPFGSYKDDGDFVLDPVASRRDREVKTYTRGKDKAYVYSYGFDPSPLHLRKSQDRLEAYKAANVADTNWKVRTETLNVMGLSYLLELKLSSRMIATRGRVLPSNIHAFARLGQEAAYFIDFGLWGLADASYSGSRTAETATWQTAALFGSALEHGMIEQMQGTGVTAISTTKIIHLANQQGIPLHLVNDSNWESVKPTLLSNGWPTIAVDSIEGKVNGTANFNQGAEALLPQRGNIGLTASPAAGTWRGYGYAFLSADRTTMAISGGYNAGEYSGGYLSDDEGAVQSATVTADAQSSPGYASMNSYLNSAEHDPETIEKYGAGDPVDMATGGFTLEATDLECGRDFPQGLVFRRSYDSNRYRDKDAGLGYGWTHNLDITATVRSGSRAGFGDAGVPGQMAPMYVATAVALDVFSNRFGDNKPARDWAIAALMAKWGIDQVIRNGVVVSAGNAAYEFIKVPNTASGIFVPPAGVTASLTAVGGGFAFTERHGNTTRFNSAGRVTEIEDVHAKKALFTYLTNGRLDKVVDCYNRQLKLTWTNNRLTKVVETAGSLTREVVFGYSGDTLSTADDPELRRTTYGYEAQRLTSVKDGLNRFITENVYDAMGRVMQQRLHGDPAKTFNLYYSGDCNTEKNPRGDRTCYLYDRLGRNVGMIDAEGNRNIAIYDGQNQIVQEISPANLRAAASYGWTIKTYDANRNLTSIQLPKRSELDADGPYNAARVYDSQFRLWKEYDFKGRYVEYTYTAKHQIHTIRDRKGNIVQTNTYRTDGLPESVMDAELNLTEFLDFDAWGNPQTIKYPAVMVEGVSVRPTELFTYDARGNTLSHTDPNGNLTSYTYNKARQLRVTTLPAVDGSTFTQEKQYDAAGYENHVKDARNYWTDPLFSATGKLLQTTFPATEAGVAVKKLHYDSQDWLEMTESSLGLRATMEYDGSGRAVRSTDPLSRGSHAIYDEDGELMESRDARGRSTRFRRNARGEIYESLDSENATNTTTFDKNGNKATLVNGRSKTYRFDHDENDNLVSLKTPLLKEATSGWNTAGRLWFIQEASGDRVEYVYDSIGQIKDTLYKAGGSLVSTTSASYDKAGNIKKVTETTGSASKIVEFPTYDSWNRPRQFVDIRGDTIGYRYDANGNLAELIYPDGKGSVHYTWDAMNRLKTVTDWANRKTTYFYDIDGRLTSIQNANGTKRVLAWDAAGQLKALSELKQGGELIYSVVNRHDDGGRRTSETVFPAPHTVTLPGFDATYDDDNRLLTLNGSSPSSDDDGNLLSGPTATNPSASFAYDSRNRLLSAESLSYGYDSLGGRTSVTSGSGETKWTIDPTEELSRALVRELPNGEKTWYIYGLGLLYEVGDSGSTTTYHTDSRGSTVALTAGDGTTVVDRFEYDSFGRETWRMSTFDTPFRYHGSLGVQTDSNGLCYMRKRYYNPYIQRFLNPDPLGFAGGQNWFLFAGGDPMMKVDPTGEFAWIFAGAAIGAVIDAGFTAYGHLASGKPVDWKDVGRAAVRGAISGAVAAVAGPMGGTVMKLSATAARSAVRAGLSTAASGSAAKAVGVMISGGGSVAGQVAYNVLSGERNVMKGAGLAFVGGAGGQMVGNLIPVRGATTLAQARYFSPRRFSSLGTTSNSRRLLGSYAASYGAGLAPGLVFAPPWGSWDNWGGNYGGVMTYYGAGEPIEFDAESLAPGSVPRLAK